MSLFKDYYGRKVNKSLKSMWGNFDILFDCKNCEKVK